MRYRITVRGDRPTNDMRVELRGYIDCDLATLGRFADAIERYGLVIGSPAEDDYDPFTDWRH